MNNLLQMQYVKLSIYKEKYKCLLYWFSSGIYCNEGFYINFNILKHVPHQSTIAFILHVELHCLISFSVMATLVPTPLNKSQIS